MKMGASAGAVASAGLGIAQNFAEAVSAYHDGNADGVRSAACKAGDHALAASLTAILKVPITVTLFEVRTLNRSPMTCSYIETAFLLAHIHRPVRTFSILHVSIQPNVRSTDKGIFSGPADTTTSRQEVGVGVKGASVGAHKQKVVSKFDSDEGKTSVESSMDEYGVHAGTETAFDVSASAGVETRVEKSLETKDGVKAQTTTTQERDAVSVSARGGRHQDRGVMPLSQAKKTHTVTVETSADGSPLDSRTVQGFNGAVRTDYVSSRTTTTTMEATRQVRVLPIIHGGKVNYATETNKKVVENGTSVETTSKGYSFKTGDGGGGPISTTGHLDRDENLNYTEQTDVENSSTTGFGLYKSEPTVNTGEGAVEGAADPAFDRHSNGTFNQNRTQQWQDQSGSRKGSRAETSKGTVSKQTAKDGNLRAFNEQSAYAYEASETSSGELQQGNAKGSFFEHTGSLGTGTRQRTLADSGGVLNVREQEQGLKVNTRAENLSERLTFGNKTTDAVTETVTATEAERKGTQQVGSVEPARDMQNVSSSETLLSMHREERTHSEGLLTATTNIKIQDVDRFGNVTESKSVNVSPGCMTLAAIKLTPMTRVLSPRIAGIERHNPDRAQRAQQGRRVGRQGERRQRSHSCGSEHAGGKAELRGHCKARGRGHGQGVRDVRRGRPARGHLRRWRRQSRVGRCHRHLCAASRRERSRGPGSGAAGQCEPVLVYNSNFFSIDAHLRSHHVEDRTACATYPPFHCVLLVFVLNCSFRPPTTRSSR